MTTAFSRRGFLAASAALAAIPALPRGLRAQTAPLQLTATTRTLDIGGRAATLVPFMGRAWLGCKRTCIDTYESAAGPEACGARLAAFASSGR